VKRELFSVTVGLGLLVAAALAPILWFLALWLFFRLRLVEAILSYLLAGLFLALGLPVSAVIIVPTFAYLDKSLPPTINAKTPEQFRQSVEDERQAQIEAQRQQQQAAAQQYLQEQEQRRQQAQQVLEAQEQRRRDEQAQRQAEYQRMMEERRQR